MSSTQSQEWLPGLVYQFQLQPDGRRSFTGLSGGCSALLGVGADDLRADPTLFEKLILDEDRASYVGAMTRCTADMVSCNWVGRIWIEAWNDIKWINLRCMPHRLAGGVVQWDGIITNITQSKLLEAEIKQSRAALADLSANILMVKEQERTRIAAEIQDDLGGNLAAIKLALAALMKHLPHGDAAQLEVSYVDALVDRSIGAMQRIASDLRPGILDFGLVAAIGWQAEEFEKQHGITCTFLANRDALALDADTSTALFRIFQEAISNVARHARASQVSVRLLTGANSLRMEISDNGCGIAADDHLKPKSFGIRGMTERVKSLGGEMSIEALPNGGSSVKLRIPLKRPARPLHESDGKLAAI
jgi:two-component system sensor histidine kinase UhpB